METFVLRITTFCYLADRATRNRHNRQAEFHTHTWHVLDYCPGGFSSADGALAGSSLGDPGVECVLLDDGLLAHPQLV